MKDQNSITDKESAKDKWFRAHSIFLESLHKPDNVLRSCAHNQKCYNELMEIRDQMLELAKTLQNPH